MNFDPSVAIAAIVALSLLACLLPAGAVWLYFRGSARLSPIPSVPRIFTPKPTPPPQPKPPSFPCPYCSSDKGYTLATSGLVWTCNAKNCGKSVPVGV